MNEIDVSPMPLSHYQAHEELPVVGSRMFMGLQQLATEAAIVRLLAT